MKVGLTGNIGSGKSTVARIFTVLGIPVFYADYEAKKLYSEKEVLQEVIDAFGNGVLDQAGNIDKAKLAEIIFGDKRKLNIIINIIHPRVRQRYQEWRQQWEQVPCTILEAAIMIESGLYKQMDVVVLVTAPQQQRLQRVAGRDGANEAEIRKRMEHQYPEEKLRTFADFTVENDEHSLVIPQVLHIHKVIKGKR